MNQLIHSVLPILTKGIIMLPVERPIYPFWNDLWEQHIETKNVFVFEASGEVQEDISETIETMLITSIPAEPMSCLRNAWSSLRFVDPLSNDDESIYRCVEELCGILKGPDQLSNEEAISVVEQLWTYQYDYGTQVNPVSQEALMAAPEFLRWLKYVALCTARQFSITWNCYTKCLNRIVLKEIRNQLFTLTMLVLLKELRQ